MTFESLNLIQPILHSLKAKGYVTPTTIQLKAIPLILDGKDIFGSAQTGTGKTAAFALPILQLLHAKGNQGKRRAIKALVLAPTRELAHQISDSFRVYGKGLHMKQAVVYGGVSQRPQVEHLRSGVDIVVATPGRLLDLIEQGYVHLQQVEFFVLDEVDRMLDMGFIHDIKKITKLLPQKKQTLFFSATLPPEIKKLADGLLHHPVTVATSPVSSTPVNVKQQIYFVDKENKKNLLIHILTENPGYHVLVFTRTKRNAERLAKNLHAMGYKAEAIHGDKTQAARQRALDQFKARKINLLIATDVASRGLDISEVTHVVNFDLPDEAEVYVHRIGRTGRAGALGSAVSFCSRDEHYLVKNIKKLTGNIIETITAPASSLVESSQPIHRDKPDAPQQDEKPHERKHKPYGHDRKHSRGGNHAPGKKKFFPRKKKWNRSWSDKGGNRSSQKE